MDIKNIEQRFNSEQIATIKDFMEFCIQDSNKSTKTFSDAGIETETNEQIAASVRDWIAERKRKGHKV
jgi:hypothetical protein